MFLEIRLHGRGGQGIVTAAEMIAEAAIVEGFYAQSIPLFGAERRGAPVSASTRISESRIRRHSQVRQPQIVAICDPLLLYMKEVFDGVPDGAVLVVNHKQEPQLEGSRVALIDATGIAVGNGLVSAGWAILSTVIFGAISKVTGVISKGTVLKVIYSRWKGEVAEKNLRAAASGYDGVKTW
ncbi:MAG: 2-oxoacid:acceptor oxidoreductase family protein [Candidatus Methanosuratincola petrocarbonis]